MLTVYLYHTENKTLASGGVELVDQWIEEESTMLWLDIEGELNKSHAQLLQEKLHLHPLALEDAARDRHPPKIEKFDDYTFLIYKGLSAEAQSIDCKTIQIAIFVGERFLVTRHSGVSYSIAALRKELEKDMSIAVKGPGALAMRLGRLIVERYLKILLELEPRLELLEEELMGDSGEAVLSELVTYKSDLIRLQRIFHYHVQISRQLSNADNPGFSAEEKHGLIDVHEQQERVNSLCALYYQLAADLIEGYISVSSHRLNQIMRVLTIITAVFVPLSFLAGVYGMNFENMPELHSRWGYFTLLAIMGFVATVLLLTFRKKKWL